MSNPDGELAERVRHLEEQVARLQARVDRADENAAAARILAGGADRDVSDMRTELTAHRQALNALRETQVEHQTEMRAGFAMMNREFAMVNDEFAKVNQEFAKVDAGFAEMRRMFATVNTGMAQIVTLIGDLDRPD